MKFNFIINNLIKWIYPPFCATCSEVILNSNLTYVCENCLKDIYFNSPPYCRICGAHNPNTQELCRECKNKIKNEIKIWFDKNFSCFLYKKTVKKILHLIKYRNKIKLALYLGNYFLDIIRENEITKNIDYIIPVPIYKTKLKKRGFNQSEVFSKIVAKNLNIKMLNNILHRYKPTIPQSELSKKARLKNIKGVFKIENNDILRNKNILLIDDIYTTGATVNECSKLLKNSSVATIKVATVAKG